MQRNNCMLTMRENIAFKDQTNSCKTIALRLRRKQLWPHKEKFKKKSLRI